MIRFLQKDNRVVKFIFIAIISVAVVTMVITLVPGIFADENTTSDTYATVHSGGLFGRYFGASTAITTPEVQQVAQRILQQKHYPDMVLPYIMPQAAQALIQREVLLQEANRLGLQVSDADLRRAMQTGPFSQALFPGGQFIGEDKYADFVSNYFHTSIQDFESQVKKEIEINRLESMVTGGITASDQEVRDAYREQGTKIKFDYAVISAEDLRKQINPTDAELQAFFKQSAARYKDAIPETRKLAYIAIKPNDVPATAKPVTGQDVEQYYQQHQKDYQVPEEVKVRHILIKVPAGADGKTDAAAKAKAEGLLKQIKAGGNFDALAKANSDDPGSKEQGGDLGMIQRGVTVPPFEQAAFSLQPGQVSDLVKTQFGYHIIKVERKTDRAPEAAGRGQSTNSGDLDPPARIGAAGGLCAAARERSRQNRPGENSRSASPAGGDDWLHGAERSTPRAAGWNKNADSGVHSEARSSSAGQWHRRRLWRISSGRR